MRASGVSELQGEREKGGEHRDKAPKAQKGVLSSAARFAQVAKSHEHQEVAAGCTTLAKGLESGDGEGQPEPRHGWRTLNPDFHREYVAASGVRKPLLNDCFTCASRAMNFCWRALLSDCNPAAASHLPSHHVVTSSALVPSAARELIRNRSWRTVISPPECVQGISLFQHFLRLTSRSALSALRARRGPLEVGPRRAPILDGRTPTTRTCWRGLLRCGESPISSYSMGDSLGPHDAPHAPPRHVDRIHSPQLCRRLPKHRLRAASGAAGAVRRCWCGCPPAAAGGTAVQPQQEPDVEDREGASEPRSSETVPLVPGSEGMGILLGAMMSAGAKPAVVGRVRAALADFERMIALHVGDRTTLEILMDGLGQGKSLEMSRKLAFRGNSGVSGLQARVRTMAAILAPNETDPEKLDLALVAGMFDIRRLRPVQGWPIFRFHRLIGASSESARARRIEPLEAPKSEADPLLIMRSWCTPPDAEVRSVQLGTEVVHELVEGPVGRTGEVSLVFGHLERAAVPRYGTIPDEMGELSALVTIPVETLIQDIALHRDIAEHFEPEVRVYGRPFGTPALDPATRENYRLPIEERLEHLGALPQLPDAALAAAGRADGGRLRQGWMESQGLRRGAPGAAVPAHAIHGAGAVLAAHASSVRVSRLPGGGARSSAPASAPLPPPPLPARPPAP